MKMILEGTPDLNTADNRARIEACKASYDNYISEPIRVCEYWHSRLVTCKDCAPKDTSNGDK